MGIIEQRIKDSIAVKESLFNNKILLKSVLDTVDVIVKAINDGGFVIMLDNREVGRLVKKYA